MIWEMGVLKLIQPVAAQIKINSPTRWDSRLLSTQESRQWAYAAKLGTNLQPLVHRTWT